MSKELEALDIIENVNFLNADSFIAIDIYKWKEIEKSLKALEIIKEKEVLVPDFIDSCRSFDFTYFHYCKYQENYSYKVLTEEEFDLLKEMLL